MALILKINSTDRSDHVRWNTVMKTEGLTKEPDTLSFVIKKTPAKTIPSLGDTVELLEDAVKIFKGTITERSEVVEGRLEGYSFNCKDPSYDLDQKLAIKSYENQTARQIVLDLISAYTSGYTTNNVALSTPTLSSFKVNYEQISKTLEKLANRIGWDWYVDYDNDVHFFKQEDNAAPFSLTDTNDNFEWHTLRFDRNILELKNAIFIRGGEYKVSIAETDAVDKYSADGTQRSFPLVYRYSNINVKKAGATQTVGVDNITDPSTVDVLYNFKEKLLKWPESSKPTSGQEVKIWGDAHVPLIALVTDDTSISTYGRREHVIIDKSITSVLEAHELAKAELNRWAEGSYEGYFKTTKTGLRTGQEITINSTIRGVNKKFKINRIVGRARGSDHMEYEVYILASGQVTFTDLMTGLLGRDRENLEISEDEVLQRLISEPETITLTDVETVTKNSPPYKWGAGSINDWKWNFATWS